MGNLIYITTCTVPNSKGVPCGEQFSCPALPEFSIMDPNAARAAGKLVGALAKHLEKKHPERIAPILPMLAVYQGFLVLNNFDTQDPQLIQSRENLRSMLHSQTRKNFVPDDKLLEPFAPLLNERDFLDAKGKQLFIDLLRNFRDFLTEQGHYGPQTPTVAQNGQAGPPIIHP
jgi:hypothetical protein